MKAIPCQNCSGAPALLPNGSVYLMGISPPSSGARFVCFRCKLPSRITAVEWHRLPECSWSQLERFEAIPMILQDLPGCTQAQLKQLHAAGIKLGELHAPDTRQANG